MSAKDPLDEDREIALGLRPHPDSAQAAYERVSEALHAFLEALGVGRAVEWLEEKSW